MIKKIIALLMIDPWEQEANPDWWLPRIVGGLVICFAILICLALQGHGGNLWHVADVLLLNLITFALSCWMGR